MARTRNEKKAESQNQRQITRSKPPKDETIRRRLFILKSVRERGEVSRDDIQKHFGLVRPPHPTSLQKDDEFFQQYKLDVQLRDGRFVPQSNVPWTFELRQHQNTKEKEQIARLAAIVLAGQPPTRKGDQLEFADPDQQSLWQQISEESPVRNKLLGYWRKRHRHAALDAGTTVRDVAECLQRCEPIGFSTIRIVTNCTRIESLYDDPRRAPHVDIISVGGELRKDTAARAGILAERTLKAMAIEVDISMVGTTSLRLDTYRKCWGFACDSEYEATIKSLMLDGGVKSILMDSSKVDVHRSSAFTFATLNITDVDLVITDWRIREKRIDGEDAVSYMRRKGVVVLIGGESK